MALQSRADESSIRMIHGKNHSETTLRPSANRALRTAAWREPREGTRTLMQRLGHVAAHCSTQPASEIAARLHSPLDPVAEQLAVKYSSLRLLRLCCTDCAYVSTARRRMPRTSSCLLLTLRIPASGSRKWCTSPWVIAVPWPPAHACAASLGQAFRRWKHIGRIR